tara:strand:- start:2006 stop:2380 length:375 start_codon:yes stop_codon:yes gene_type:complete
MYEILITKEMVEAYGKITNDYNPLHFDEEYAKRTKFGGTIVHGMLIGGLISSSLVDHYGWGIIYISQTLDFRVPVRIGDKVKIVFKGEVYLPKNRLQLFVDVSVMDQTVVEGQALIIIPFKKEF